MKNKALVLDIRRFSTHDGVGIRTTVFFKGCPLHCVWCQNPEGIAPQTKLVYFANSCILCGCCTQIKDGAVHIENDKLILDSSRVKNTGDYEYICPSGALRMDSKWYEPDELTEILKRDMPFFKHGGGVTFSGGEPFYQAKFTISILKRLKKIKINTAVESSLFTDSKTIKAALPFIDTLFADFKIYNDTQHKNFTGVSNKIIRENIKMVLQSLYRDNVVIRTPLIPMHTANADNLRKIAKEISEWYPGVRYELLNYNPLAKAKYDHMDYDYCFADNPPLYTKQQMEDFYKIIEDAGIVNVIK